MAEKKIKPAFFISFILSAAFLSGCISAGVKEAQDESFRYDEKLRLNYDSKGEGGSLPVTIGKEVEMDGTVTSDGKYMFYSSDKERGNYDIYLRSLTGIETVRITKNPSKDIAPAVSPDGRYLAFVSLRDDPQGDIYIIKMPDLSGIIHQAWTLFEQDYESGAKNLTQQTDERGTPVSFKDSDPVWSPDGSYIAFSSNRSGEENIWLMTRDGKRPQQISHRGGIQPCFSGDNKTLLFISYRDNPQGDLYSVNIETEVETRITAQPGLKLHPCFLSSSNECLFTMIDSDTNKDGAVDFKDKSVIQYLDIAARRTYPLSFKSVSSFKPRYYPVYPLINFITKQNYSKGIIVYSEQSGENINISIMPDIGIIPKRIDLNLSQKDGALQQFELAMKYSGKRNPDEYPLALMRVYYFHGSRTEDISIIYCARALSLAALEFDRLGQKDQSLKAMEYLKSMSKIKNDYCDILYAATDASLQKKRNDQIFETAFSVFSRDSIFVPSLYEDYAMSMHSRGDSSGAEKIYRRIAGEYPAYSRISAVYYNIWKIEQSRGGKIPYTYQSLLEKSTNDIMDEVSSDLISWFNREKDPDKRIILANAHLSYYEKIKKSGSLVIPVLEYINASAYFEKGDIKKSLESLTKTLAGVSGYQSIYYDANNLRARIAAKEGKQDEEALYYYNVVQNYSVKWKRQEIVPIISSQIAYYERRGQEYEALQDYGKAASVYSKYVELMKLVHNMNAYEDLYNEYAPRAHVFYIDSYAASKSSAATALDELEDRYINTPKKLKETISIARRDFDKAHLFGLAYIYTLKGAEYYNGAGETILQDTDSLIIENFKKAEEQIAWANFMDDSFVDPLILQGWINQAVDIKRKELKESGDEQSKKTYDSAFADYLWERNRDLYEKGLESNNEARFPEKEGLLHLNLANSFFLLRNFSSALNHYEASARYKKNFGSRKEESIFRFHLSYCYWQLGDVEKAEKEMLKVLNMYQNAAADQDNNSLSQKIRVYQYLALFSRTRGDYNGALSWNSRALSEADSDSPDIDRSRLNLECAWCSLQMNDYGKTEKYLLTASNLLEKERGDDPKKIRVAIFRFDADSLVIGDAKITGILSPVKKKMLIAAIGEELAVKKGDINTAMLISKNRVKMNEAAGNILEKEGYLRALNSTGCYLFNMGRYDEASAYFETAWKFATSSKNQNLQGAFVSMQNLASLKAHLADISDSNDEKTSASLNDLLLKMDSFRAQYQIDLYNERIKALEKDYKEAKQEVTDTVRASVLKEIIDETIKTHSELDLSRAVISFYKSEIDGGFLQPQAAPYGNYAASKALFDNYKRDADVFLSIAEDGSISALKRGRLLMNAAVCRMRNGMAQKAYELFGEAEALLIPLGKNDVLWELYYKEAQLLRQTGSEIDKDSSTLALKYYEKAAAAVEEVPALSATSPEKIEKMYRDYAFFLAERNEKDKALSILEKGSAVSRVVSVFRSSPVFKSRKDKNDFDRYCGIIAELKNRISLLGVLSQKEKTDSNEIKRVSGDVANLKSGYKDFVAALKTKNPELSMLISPEISLSAVKNTAMRIESDSGFIYVWKTGKTAGVSVFKENDFPGIDSFIKQAAPEYIVYNKTAAGFFAGNRSESSEFMFVPSIDCIRFLPAPGYADPAAYALVKNGWIQTEKNPYTYDLIRGDSAQIISLLYGREIYPAVVNLSEARDTALNDVLYAAMFSGASVVAGNDSIQTDLKDINNRSMSLAFLSPVRYARDKETSAAMKRSNEERSRNTAAADKKKSAALMLKNEVKNADNPAGVYFYNMSDNSALIDKARLSAASGSNSEKSFYIWLLLMRGDVSTADLICSAVDRGNIPETGFYRSLILHAVSDSGKEAVYPDKSVIDPYMLHFLKARYDFIEGRNSSVNGSIPPGYLSEIQSAQAVLAAGDAVQKGSEYADELSAIIKQPTIENALSLFDEEHPLRTLAFAYVLSKGNVSADTLKSIDVSKLLKGDFLDDQALLSAYKRSALKSGMTDAALAALQMQEEAAKSRNLKEYSAGLMIERAEILNRKGRFSESRALLISNEQNISESRHAKFVLLLSEAEISTGAYSGAMTRLSKESFKDGKDNYIKYLLSAAAERGRIIADASYRQEGLTKYEENIKQALSELKNGDSFERRDLLFSGIDFLISLNLAGGNIPRSLYYQELKKQLIRYAYTGEKNIILLEDARLAEFRKLIKDDSVVMCVSRNEDDLFVWMIQSQKVEFVRLKSGWKEAERINAAYSREAEFQRSLGRVMSDLDTLFSSVLPVIKSKKRLYIIPDMSAEKIPFELIGKDSPLASKVDIFYLESISAAFGGRSHSGTDYSLRSSDAGNEWMDTDKAALVHSRIRQSHDGRNLRVLHVMDPDGSRIGEYLKESGGASIVFSRSRKNMMPGMEDFAKSGVSAYVSANPALIDVNISLFADVFYSSLQNNDAEKAFLIAKNRLSEHIKYGYPAYWAGIRLYLNGMSK